MADKEPLTESSPPTAASAPRTPVAELPIPPASQGLNFGFQATPSAPAENQGVESAKAGSGADSSQLPTQSSKGGGFFGAIKNMIGGSQPGGRAGEEEVTAVGKLQDGTTATVATAPDAETVPASLENATGAAPVGAAKTELKEPISDYAPALESIAGPAEAADPTKKFAPALTPLTGEGASVVDTGKAAVGGIVGAVTVAASNAVETVKQATGLGLPASGDATTPKDLPASGKVQPTGDGGAKIVPVGGAVTAGDAKVGGDVVNPADLPKSGVVHPTGTGSAEITPAEGEGAPSTLSSVTNTVSSGANYVASAVGGAVTGLVGRVAGTSENATDADAAPTALTGDRSAAPTSEPVQYEDEPATAAAKDPIATSANGTAPKEVRLGGAKVPKSAFAEEPTAEPAAETTEGVKSDVPATTEGGASATPASATVPEVTAAEGVSEAKPAASAASAAAGKKEGEKDKAPACGCCVIS